MVAAIGSVYAVDKHPWLRLDGFDTDLLSC